MNLSPSHPRRDTGLRRFKVLAALCVLSCLLAGATDAFADARWSTDIEASAERAKEYDRHLLFYFSGSDWNEASIDLHADLFAGNAFYTWAKSRVELVQLDFPKAAAALTQTVHSQNRHWRYRLGVPQLPSLYLLDAKLRPYRVINAKTSHMEGDLIKRDIESSRMRGKLFANFMDAAGIEQGIERAVLLHEALLLVDQQLYPFYRQEMQMIVDLDAAPEGGTLRSHWQVEIQRIDVMEQMQEAFGLAESGQLQGAIAKIDQIITRNGLTTGSLLQEVLISKAQFTLALGSKESCLAVLQKAHAADPNSRLAREIRDRISTITTGP